MPTVYCDTSDLGELIKDVEEILSPQGIRVAVSKALNATLTYIGAETKRQVQSEYYVTKSIQKTLTKKRAKPSHLVAEAIYTDKPLPLFVFKHTAARNPQRSPVTVTIKRANGAQTHGGSNPAMFKTYSYKYKKVMIREAGQKNIRTAYTLSIPQMVASDEVYKVIAKKAEAKLYERTKYFLSRRISDI